ncbi:PadR family transcriptional regulator, partial [Stenotrophomonas geniculata]
ACALREFKRALVHHHGRWAEGEADEVAALLTRASALLNGTAGNEQPPISMTQPD